ncbi:hypothetical protein [Streptomyces mirabilis]|uniref:hypothetical protein n=1 Tax=Streptomyces mirabilis TaxID=68239 RepID=UPI00224E64BA|nr:hypothetical protein [Streptomyces mirabilis]MCX4617945.1 hypothetical protein [Streptomyces mirabilis]
MARTKPSALELAMVAAVGERGFTVSPTQLERWRTQLWLARTADWTDPETGELRPEIVHRAAALAGISKTGRRISWFGWVFWAIDATPESTARLRAAVADAFERPFRGAGVDFSQIPQGDSDDAFDARREMAARMLMDRRCPRRDFDGALRAGAAGAEVELPPSRSVSNIFHPALMDPGARMLIGGIEDVGFDEMVEAWAAATPGNPEMIEHIRAAQRDAALAGDDLFAQFPLAHGLPGLIRAVQEADSQRLCTAVLACTKASTALTMLLPHVANEPEILRTLMADEMWDQWVRVGFAPVLGIGGEAAIAMSVIQHLLFPGWAEELERYQTLMDTLLAQPPAV